MRRTKATGGGLTRLLDRSASITVLGGKKKCTQASAQAMNDAGVISGNGWDNDRSLHLGFVASPT